MSIKLVLLAACAALAAASRDLVGDIGSGEPGSGSGSGSGSPPPPLDTQVSFTQDSGKPTTFFTPAKMTSMTAGMSTYLALPVDQITLDVAAAPPSASTPGRRLSESTTSTLSWTILASEKEAAAAVVTIVATSNQQWNQALGGGTAITGTSTPTVSALGGSSNNVALGVGVGLGVGIPVLLVGGYVFMKGRRSSGSESGVLQLTHG